MSCSRKYKIFTVSSHGIDKSLLDLSNVLESLKENVEKHVILFDFSRVVILDSHEIKKIIMCIQSIKMQGFDSVVVGLKPGIVASAVNFGFDTSRLKEFPIFINIEQAIDFVQHIH